MDAIFFCFLCLFRARASFNFDKACKWRACILYCKNQWKINIFRFLCFLHFCLRNWFPWNFPSFFPCKIFEFLEGAICLFWINFWCYFGWFWLQFGIQDPSGGLPGGTSKKHPILIPILIDFWLFWSLPGAPKIGEKQLGCSCVVVPFWRQKRIVDKMRLQDVILEHLASKNKHFAGVSIYFFVFLCVTMSQNHHSRKASKYNVRVQARIEYNQRIWFVPELSMSRNHLKH